MGFTPVDTEMKKLKSLLLSPFSFLLPFSFPFPLAHHLPPAPSRSAGAHCPATYCVMGGGSSQAVGENIPLGVKGYKLQRRWMSAGQTLV